jgi:hypothetical protein
LSVSPVGGASTVTAICPAAPVTATDTKAGAATVDDDDVDVVDVDVVEVVPVLEVVEVVDDVDDVDVFDVDVFDVEPVEVVVGVEVVLGGAGMEAADSDITTSLVLAMAVIGHATASDVEKPPP